MLIKAGEKLLGIDPEGAIRDLASRYEGIAEPTFSDEEYALLQGTAFEDIDPYGRGAAEQDMTLDLLSEIANTGYTDADICRAPAGALQISKGSTRNTDCWTRPGE